MWCGLVPQGQTPLHVAASIGHTGLFDLLLTHGADIFRVDDLHQVGTHPPSPHPQPITKRRSYSTFPHLIITRRYSSPYSAFPTHSFTLDTHTYTYTSILTSHTTCCRPRRPCYT